MDNTILYIEKFTHHDLKIQKVWWKSDKRFGSWSRQTGRFLYTPPPQTMFARGIIKISNYFAEAKVSLRKPQIPLFSA